MLSLSEKIVFILVQHKTVEWFALLPHTVHSLTFTNNCQTKNSFKHKDSIANSLWHKHIIHNKCKLCHKTYQHCWSVVYFDLIWSRPHFSTGFCRSSLTCHSPFPISLHSCIPWRVLVTGSHFLCLHVITAHTNLKKWTS